jgi:hypothetical protein
MFSGGVFACRVKIKAELENGRLTALQNENQPTVPQNFNSFPQPDHVHCPSMRIEIFIINEDLIIL